MRLACWSGGFPGEVEMAERDGIRGRFARAAARSGRAGAARQFQRDKAGGGRSVARVLDDLVAEPDSGSPLFGLLAATSTGAAPFRGRRGELAWLKHWWDDPGQPVAAVTGPPGTGKTRLVTQFAMGIRAPWTAGWLVSSYTATIRALRYARRPNPAPGAQGRALIVAMPVTPGLPGATQPLVPSEVGRVREFLPGAMLLAEPGRARLAGRGLSWASDAGERHPRAGRL
jgi:hypothetical protein